MSGKASKAARRAEREAKGIEKHTGKMRIFHNVEDSKARADANRDADAMVKRAAPVRIKLWCPKCHRRIESAIKHPTLPGVLLSRCPGCRHDWKLTPQGAHASESARVQRTTVEEVASEVLNPPAETANPNETEPEPTIAEIAEANGTTEDVIRGLAKNVDAAVAREGNADVIATAKPNVAVGEVVIGVDKGEGDETVAAAMRMRPDGSTEILAIGKGAHAAESAALQAKAITDREAAKGCERDTDGDGNCPGHPEGCPAVRCTLPHKCPGPDLTRDPVACPHGEDECSRPAFSIAEGMGKTRPAHREHPAPARDPEWDKATPPSPFPPERLPAPVEPEKPRREVWSREWAEKLAGEIASGTVERLGKKTCRKCKRERVCYAVPVSEAGDTSPTCRGCVFERAGMA